MSYEQFATWRDQPEDLQPLLSVIIPAYNESGRIVPTIASIASHLAEAGLSFEIIVSDDGSTDGTPDLCRNLGLRNLIVLAPGFNRGKGAAVRDGVRAANGELILFSDADLSTPIEEIDAMLGHCLDADVVIGSRAAEGADEGAKPLHRRVLSAACRRLVGIGLGLAVEDSQCGFKLFRRSAAHSLFGLQRIDGFSFDAEVLFLAQRLGLRVREVPVRWVDAPGSTVSSAQVSMAFLADIVRIRAAAILGRYRHPASMGSGLRVGVVTALPPSEASLTEYGHHLVANVSAVPEVNDVVVFAEDSCGTPASTNEVTVVPGWRFDSYLTPVRIIRAVRHHRPDIVFFNVHFTSFGARKVVAALGLLLPAVLRILGFPTVVLLHNLVDTTDLDAAGYSTRRLQERAFRMIGAGLTRMILKASHVVTTMPEYVEILRERYGARNVSLTPHGAFEAMPLTDMTPQEGPERRPHRVLAFGKFGTYKRLEDLVEAQRLLVADGSYGDIELVIAGTDSPVTPGYLASVEAEFGDVPGLLFTGYVAEEDVAPLFRSVDVVVFPYTATTGSSGPLHQAGSYGRAVVAPQLGDFVDLILEEGYAVEAFDPGSPESLADALAALLGDPELRRAMGEQNHAAAVGLPLADIAEWHVTHFENVLSAP